MCCQFLMVINNSENRGPTQMLQINNMNNNTNIAEIRVVTRP